MSTCTQTEQSLREDVCEIGRRLWQRGLVAANDGNLSARLHEEQVICTPTGVSKGFLKPSELVITDMGGKPIGDRRASSELKMHLEIYRHRSDVQAIVHAHPPHATALAVLQKELPRYVMPEMEVLLGPVAFIPYRTPGTVEFADAFRPAIETSDVYLLSNHGATTTGRTLDEAWYRMESLDQCCRILLLAMQVGTVKQISERDWPALNAQRELYRKT